MLGMVSILDSSGQLRLAFDEANKSASVHEPMAGIPDESDRQIKWLESLKSYGKKPDKELGAMKIEGRDCLGFEGEDYFVCGVFGLGRCKNKRFGSG